MKYFRQAHVIYHTEYHVVWIPRFRRKILVPGVTEHLSKQFDDIHKHHPDITFLERNIQPDHVHCLLGIPPKMSVSDAMCVVKTNTSKALQQRFPFLAKVYLDHGGIWSVGYFVSTVGINERIIRRYIRTQEKEDIGQAKLEM
jgi:putative transposase